MIAVEMSGVSKALRVAKGPIRIFENLHAVFPLGASVGILGVRGSGKTTLVRLVAGLTLPDHGRVRRYGKVSAPIATANAYHPALTGRENLHFVARVNGFDGDAAADFVARFARLGDAIDQPLSSYLRERRSRFMFAASYALPFDIYVGDEVLIGGSGIFREQCTKLVQARRAHSSFIFTTRSPMMLRRFADIGAVLHNGHLHMFDRIDDAIAAFLALDSTVPPDDDEMLEAEGEEEPQSGESFSPLL